MSSVPDPRLAQAPRPSRGPYQPWTQTLLIVLIAAAAVYLITNHWLHVLDALPYLGVVLVMSFVCSGMEATADTATPAIRGTAGRKLGEGLPAQGPGKLAGMSTDYGYDLWWLVILNSAVFIIFAFSFVRPRTKLDWRALGGFSAFIVALFTEMYGFPLTIYLLSGWLGNSVPGLDLLNHNSGHLWQDLTGWQGDPHLSPLHLLSNVLIAAGFILLYLSWQVLFAAQRITGWQPRALTPGCGIRSTWGS